MQFVFVLRCRVGGGILDVKIHELDERRVQKARALKGHWVKNIRWVQVVLEVKFALGNIGNLGSFAMTSLFGKAGGGGNEVQEVGAMRSIGECDNHVRAQAGGVMRQLVINNRRSSILEWVILMDVSSRLGDSVCLLKDNVGDGRVRSDLAANRSKAVAHRVVQQITPIELVAVKEVQAERIDE